VYTAKITASVGWLLKTGLTVLYIICFIPITYNSFIPITDSLTELKGSSSYNRKKPSGQDSVPKFSLSDVSDDELKSHGQVF
jgi:hypothetical protein